MVPFKLKLIPGDSIFDQVVFAATRSILAGELKAGETFPSVRALALDLKIHPNTAHNVVQHLIQERWLVAQPGVGTVVAHDGNRIRLQVPRTLDLAALLPGVGAEVVRLAYEPPTLSELFRRAVARAPSSLPEVSGVVV